jgi:lipopolysaccharide export LptBFGC system permease protein LptF
MVQGPTADRLFPAKALRETAKAEEASTPDLFYWQKWAPDPERATMLWGRLLNWMAGPCLLFAMLASAFPAPRSGRGRPLGYALVLGLLYLGLQALFSGAAKAGEIPSYWGVLSPMLILIGAGLLKLHSVKT